MGCAKAVVRAASERCAVAHFPDGVRGGVFWVGTRKGPGNSFRPEARRREERNPGVVAVDNPHADRARTEAAQMIDAGGHEARTVTAALMISSHLEGDYFGWRDGGESDGCCAFASDEDAVATGRGSGDCVPPGGDDSVCIDQVDDVVAQRGLVPPGPELDLSDDNLVAGHGWPDR